MPVGWIAAAGVRRDGCAARHFRRPCNIPAGRVAVCQRRKQMEIKRRAGVERAAGGLNLGPIHASLVLFACIAACIYVVAQRPARAGPAAM